MANLIRPRAMVDQRKAPFNLQTPPYWMGHEAWSTAFWALDRVRSVRSVACLNGDLPGSAFFAAAAARGLDVVAADGAADALLARGVRPHHIVGDLDSATPHALATSPHTRLLDQSTSDAEKMSSWLLANLPGPSIWLGVGGGHLDHVMHNLGHMAIHGLDGVACHPPLAIWCLGPHNTPSCDTLPQGTKLSLIPWPWADVHTQGLRWEVDGAIAIDGGRNDGGHHEPAGASMPSYFNRVMGDKVHVHVRKGLVIVMAYLVDVNDAGSPSWRHST